MFVIRSHSTPKSQQLGDENSSWSEPSNIGRLFIGKFQSASNRKKRSLCVDDFSPKILIRLKNKFRSKNTR